MNRDAPVSPAIDSHRVSAPSARVAAGLLLGLALAGSAVAQLRSPGPPSGDPGPAAAAPLRITTARVTGRVVERSVETVGTLAAWEEGVARAPLAGTVVRLYADLGDPVREGQPLADLDRREADVAMDQLTTDLTAARDALARARVAADASRANLRRVRDDRWALASDVERARTEAEARHRELERAQTLRAQDLIATRDVDEARSRSAAADALVVSAEAGLGQHSEELRAAEAQLQADLDAVEASEALVRQREGAIALGRTRPTVAVVASPLTGVVAKRFVTAGAPVTDGTPLFTVVATDPLKYAGTVPERAAAEVRNGQELRLSIDAVSGRVFPGEVTRVAQVVDASTRTLALEARLLNGEKLLRPGLAAHGTILIRQDTGVPFVPAEALVQIAGASQVFVVIDGRVEARGVTTGRRETGWVEIVRGVRPGEMVATSSLAQLSDGARVAPMAPTPKTP
jgi:multidrug efflux pump subunit AcrA (membrane-fusion protein)